MRLLRKKIELGALQKKIWRLEEDQWVARRRMEDVHALAVLQPLLANRPVLPFSGASLRPYCLLHIINDILLNRRRRVIEFGTGISTLVLGRLIAQNALATTLLSIDHDERWTCEVADRLGAEGLGQMVRVVAAPLRGSNLAVENNSWYDTEILASETSDGDYDLLIVDGPPAWEPSKAKARYAVLPFMFERMKDRCAIYLDDANRPGERAVLSEWTQAYNIPFRITGGTLAYVMRGPALYTEPLTDLKL